MRYIMNIKNLLEKLEAQEKAESEFALEYKEWEAKAILISRWLTELLNKKTIKDSHLFYFSYYLHDQLKLDISEDLVTIKIYDYEDDQCGKLSIPTHIFCSDEWKNYIIDIVEKSVKEIAEQQRITKDKSELKEFVRLKTIYENQTKNDDL